MFFLKNYIPDLPTKLQFCGERNSVLLPNTEPGWLHGICRAPPTVNLPAACPFRLPAGGLPSAPETRCPSRSRCPCTHAVRKGRAPRSEARKGPAPPPPPGPSSGRWRAATARAGRMPRAAPGALFAPLLLLLGQMPRLLLPVVAAPAEPELLQCQVVIAGGSAASLAAALTAAAAAPAATVCLTDPTDWLGGQLTASAVSAIDGPMLSITGRTGHALMAALGSPANPGACWVSTMCYEPANLVKDYIVPAVARLPNLLVLNRTVIVRTESCSTGRRSAGPLAGGENLTKRVCAIHAVQRTPKAAAARGEWSRLLSASVRDWYSPATSDLFTKRLLRITGDVFVEATEFGDVLMTGAAEPGLELPFVQGIEEPKERSRTTDDQCGQAATLTFYTRIANATGAPVSPTVPAGSAGDGLPFDIPNDGEGHALPTPWEWDDIFTYRRARLGPTAPPGATSAVHGGKVYIGDLTQQNWGGGNDLEGGYLWLPAKDALAAARGGVWAGGLNTTALSMLEQRAYGWFHYYQNHSHMSNSSAALQDGTAIVVLDRAATGTETGLAKMPYLRDTRRSVGLDGFRLQYGPLANAGNRSSRYGVRFADTVAIGNYAHDTHGLADSICKIPGYVTDAPPAKPYYIPFRALTSDGADNLLVGELMKSCHTYPPTTHSLHQQLTRTYPSHHPQRAKQWQHPSLRTRRHGCILRNGAQV